MDQEPVGPFGRCLNDRVASVTCIEDIAVGAGAADEDIVALTSR